MIAFGIALTDADQFENFAGPGIEFCREPDTRTMVYDSAGSIFRNYNLILDEAAKIEGLETIVLIHQDAEITDPDFIPKVREALAEHPDVAIVGCAGAVGVRNIAWWEGSVTWASFTHRYTEMGGGEIPAVSWLEGRHGAYAEARRGRLGRRLRDGFLTLGDPEPPLRRVDRHRAPRLRLRHLHAGPPGRQEGGDRRPEGRPPPLAQAGQRRRELGRGAASNSPRSGKT